jgi:aspartate ammonia-lyase
LGHAPGTYAIVNPIEDVNLHQSTNDTYPTALKTAAIIEIRTLEKALVHLLEAFQRKEKEFAHIVKVGRTQMQDAVLTTLGRTMSAFAEALGRDRWRIYKCEERLKTVNLGGTAIGTGLAAPRQYIFKVSENLKKLTGIAVTRAENLVEATQNNDALVEVSGILNALASNLLKISGDLRLMASGPDAGFAEINLPPRQAGSSIMPGKVNPVIPEAVSQAALTVLSNNVRLTTACSLGSLELNPFMPLIADALLESIQLLKNAASIMTDNCINGITANEKKCASSVNGSTATLTALIDSIGYEKAEILSLEMKSSGKTLRELVMEKAYMTGETFDKLISAESVMMLGKSPTAK